MHYHVSSPLHSPHHNQEIKLGSARSAASPEPADKWFFAWDRLKNPIILIECLTDIGRYYPPSPYPHLHAPLYPIISPFLPSRYLLLLLLLKSHLAVCEALKAPSGFGRPGIHLLSFQSYHMRLLDSCAAGLNKTGQYSKIQLMQRRAISLQQLSFLL